MRTSVSMILATTLLITAPSMARADQLRTGYEEPDREFQNENPLIGPGTILFFNKNGGTYTETFFGGDDSRTNRTSLNGGTLSPYSCGEQQWQQVMTCLRETFGPYNIEVTDVDPGASVQHMEVVVAGLPSQVGYGNGTGGIAPVGCNLSIDNPITYAFGNIYCNRVNELCHAAAQEPMHSIGLDHEIECKDPLTYDTRCGTLKRFQNVNSACGESSEYPPNQPSGELSGARSCRCTGSSTQNTHQFLLGVFGPGNDDPPEVSFTEPQNGANVESGFRITVAATDDISMDRVEVWIDGALWKTATTSPYIFLTDPLAGAHSITARAMDKNNHITDVNISVTVNPPCTVNTECDTGEICSDGQCIPGPGTPGGLGSPCTDSAACASGICAGGPDGMRCVEVCTPGGTDCPDGFDCLGAGGGGACWPTQETLDPGGDGSGGCVVGGGQRDSSLIAAALAMLAAALLFGRRRR